MRSYSGLHLLGADPAFVISDTPSAVATATPFVNAPAPSGGGQTNYMPYIDAAAGLARGITEGLRSQPPPPAPRPPPPPESSNTVWYVGGAAVLAVVVALLVRSR